MAKSMARIENGVIVNMEWCSDTQPQTDTLIDPGDRPVGIGDTYADGQFYRDGVRILTPLEEALAKIRQLEDENASLEAAYAEGVASA